MPRVIVTIVFIFAAAVAAAGCSMARNLTDAGTGDWFSKPLNPFKAPAWARNDSGNEIKLGPSGPVAPENLVDASGRCAQPAPTAPVEASARPSATDVSKEPAPKAAPATPEKLANRPVGSFAGDLASAPMPTAPARGPRVATSAPPSDRLQPEGTRSLQPAPQQILGGIMLGMSECQVVRRAGLPSHVDIGADRKGDRKVVLTYLNGSWPGIYRFNSGRLKEIDRALGAANSVGRTPKKKIRTKRTAHSRTTRHVVERLYVH